MPSQYRHLDTTNPLFSTNTRVRTSSIEAEELETMEKREIIFSIPVDDLHFDILPITPLCVRVWPSFSSSGDPWISPPLFSQRVVSSWEKDPRYCKWLDDHVAAMLPAQLSPASRLVPFAAK